MPDMEMTGSSRDQPAFGKGSLPGTGLKIFFWSALALYVLVLPIGGTIALRSLAFVLLLIATGALVWQSRQWPVFPLKGFWLAYALVAVASLGYAADTEYTLRNIQAEVGYGILIFIVGATWARRIAIWPGMERLVVAGCALMVGVSLWLAATVGMGPSLQVSLNAGPGNFSTYLVTVLPLVVYAGLRSREQHRSKWQAAMAVLTAAALGSLLFTENRQCFVSLLSASLLVTALTIRQGSGKREILYCVAAILLVVSVGAVSIVSRSVKEFGPTLVAEQAVAAGSLARDTASPAPAPSAAVGRSMTGDVRWALWKFSLGHMLEHPWTGGGFGREAFNLMYRDYHEAHPLLWHAHNMVINKGVQMGVPGIVSFLLLWGALFYKLWRYLDSPRGRPLALVGVSIMVCVFVKNMTDDFFLRDGALLFWLLMGAILGTLDRMERDNPSPPAGDALPAIP